MLISTCGQYYKGSSRLALTRTLFRVGTIHSIVFYENNFVLKKWANPGLFLFIFILFNNNFTEKL